MNRNSESPWRKERREARLQNAQIVSAWITAAAAIAVGIWAAWSSVYIKQEREVTSYTLRDLEMRTKTLPVVKATLIAKVDPMPTGESLLEATVLLSNLGNEECRVVLDRQAMVLVRVFMRNGEPQYQPEISLFSSRYWGQNRAVGDFIDIAPGETYELKYIRSIENSGIYLVRFLAVKKSSYTEKFKFDVGLPDGAEYSTGADAYIVLE
jgi:hypothetical protein